MIERTFWKSFLKRRSCYSRDFMMSLWAVMSAKVNEPEQSGWRVSSRNFRCGSPGISGVICSGTLPRRALPKSRQQGRHSLNKHRTLRWEDLISIELFRYSGTILKLCRISFFHCQWSVRSASSCEERCIKGEPGLHTLTLQYIFQVIRKQHEVNPKQVSHSEAHLLWYWNQITMELRS